ncbi:hypothetical protein B7494_g2536 [Chlorociboria aeruginascens]|nr:hypothetical protein B7494_g2536 [Chlorociboria aeruginascens]
MFPNISHMRSQTGEPTVPKALSFESYIRSKLTASVPREPLSQAPPASNHVTDRPPPNQSQLPRRLPVGEATLSTYAIMRGGSQLSDPLHQALYIFQNPLYNDLASLHGSTNPKLAVEGVGPRVYWWEKPRSVPLREQSKPKSGNEEYDGHSAPTKRQLSFREHQRMHPPQPKSNHYRGEQALQEYGYFPVNGIWADPDSNGSLDLASKHLYEPGMKPPPRPYPPLPRSLTREEEDAMYRDFEHSVTDDVDRYGDPRNMRITPEVFALWAEGAKRANSYVETIVEPQEVWSTTERRDRQNNRIRKPLHEVTRKLQFDIEDGSAMSGSYEPDESSSLLVTADGVELGLQPENFTLMLPQVYKDLGRAMFSRAYQVEEWLQTTGPSLGEFREEITSEVAREALGIDRFAHVQEKKKKIDAEAVDYYSSFAETKGMYMDGEARKVSLSREVYFLKRHLDNINDRRSRKQNTIKRLLREDLDASSVLSNMALKMRNMVTGNAKKTMVDIEGLESERDALLEELGVSSVDEIPGLIPLPTYHPREEILKRFGKE